MKMFASRNEALVFAVITAFFALVTIFFSLQPLYFAVKQTKNITPDSQKTVFSFSENTAEENIITLLPYLDDKERAMAQKTAELLDAMHIKVFAIETGLNGIAIKTTSNTNQLADSFKRILASQNPKETKTRLPDGTYMIEIVIDPAAQSSVSPNINKTVDYYFNKTSPNLILINNTEYTTIFIGRAVKSENNNFNRLTSCKRPNSGITVIYLDNIEKTLFSAIKSSFLAYLRDFSCFQSFSTTN
jgi:hypothetical protein